MENGSGNSIWCLENRFLRFRFVSTFKKLIKLELGINSALEITFLLTLIKLANSNWLIFNILLAHLS